MGTERLNAESECRVVDDLTDFVVRLSVLSQSEVLIFKRFDIFIGKGMKSG